MALVNAIVHRRHYSANFDAGIRHCRWQLGLYHAMPLSNASALPATTALFTVLFRQDQRRDIEVTAHPPAAEQQLC